MDIQVGDKIVLKKPHPCGSNTFLVHRIGMDFKIECTGCGHQVMVPRAKCEKRIRQVIREKD